MLGVVVIGVLVGSAIAAKASGEFRVRISGATQVVKSIAGGLCMDIVSAGLVAHYQQCHGTAQFSFQSGTAFFSMFLGRASSRKSLWLASLAASSPWDAVIHHRR